MRRPLSVNDFKDWLTESEGDLCNFFVGQEQEKSADEYIGRSVKTKVSRKKLLERIETDGDAKDLIEEFIDDGGTVVEFKDKKIQIEVLGGKFILPRFCVKIRK